MRNHAKQKTFFQELELLNVIYRNQQEKRKNDHLFKHNM
jgi:hypothetical protein